MLTATEELPLEAAAVDDLFVKTVAGLATAQQAISEHNRRRPAWLSAETVALMVGTWDFCLILVAGAVALAAYSGVIDRTLSGPTRHELMSFLAATLFVGMFERLGGYRLKYLLRMKWQFTRVVVAWGFALVVLLLIGFLTKTSEIYSRGWVLVWIVTALPLQVIGRVVLHAAAASRTVRGYLSRNVAIIGAGDEGQRLIQRICNGHDKSIAILGIFDDRKSRLPASVCGLPIRGTTDDLLRFACSTAVDEVIIALPLDAERRLKSLCDKMKALAVDVRVSLDPLADTLRVSRTGYLGDVPLLEVVDRPLKNWRAFIKFLEDQAFSLLLLAFLAPLMALIALLIKLDSPGPVFFAQRRFGFNNQVIRVLKFRTMYTKCSDPSGADRTVRNDPRVTRFGRILRWLSFDELPQLINVLRGDMSLVGPRPHAIAMKAGDRLYGEAVEQYVHRHRVKPGITGWAQVNGLRGEVDTLVKAQARVAHDIYYIEHWSPWLDLKILLKTIGILASQENAY